MDKSSLLAGRREKAGGRRDNSREEAGGRREGQKLANHRVHGAAVKRPLHRVAGKVFGRVFESL